MVVHCNSSMATLSSRLIFCLLNTYILLICLVSYSDGEFPSRSDGRIGEKLDPDFVISTGDNFYDNGLKSVDDRAFKESFMDNYTAPSLQKQWYNVLGNHDYRGDVEAQLSPMLQKMDSRWLCLESYIVDVEIMDLFLIDTTPFVENYLTEPGAHTYNWRGENNADVYINRHDHCLQHITSTTKRDGRREFVTSGGGSKAWNNDIQKDKEGLEFYHDGQGFISVELTPTVAKIVFYDVFGQVMYDFNMDKEKQLHSLMN
ncbi:hypothetical protein MKX01_035784 [Papaver californicum]|nr:hypothetical protein MKX01_035784 [Papaver californicum]